MDIFENEPSDEFETIGWPAYEPQRSWTESTSGEARYELVWDNEGRGRSNTVQGPARIWELISRDGRAVGNNKIFPFSCVGIPVEFEVVQV